MNQFSLLIYLSVNIWWWSCVINNSLSVHRTSHKRMTFMKGVSRYTLWLADVHLVISLLIRKTQVSLPILRQSSQLAQPPNVYLAHITMAFFKRNDHPRNKFLSFPLLYDSIKKTWCFKIILYKTHHSFLHICSTTVHSITVQGTYSRIFPWWSLSKCFSH